jgi:putative NIF3 family GTP cyclohydrolase 1 type 2
MGMNRRQFAAATASAIVVPRANAALLTARQLVQRITTKLAATRNPNGARDTFKCGDPDTPVTGIATTFMATLDVLQRAHRAGKNFVISHEPTFWHDPEPIASMLDDPLYRLKVEFIEKNKMVVWRQHDQMHGVRPDPIFVGWTKALGWESYRDKTDPRCYALPPTAIDAVARHLAARLKTRSLRLVGDAQMKVSKVAQGSHGLEGNMELLAKSDLIIVFEARERDTVEYVRDLVLSGQKKGMLLCAHETGEEAGMDEFARWLRTIIDEVPVEFIPAGDQFWIG